MEYVGYVQYLGSYIKNMVEAANNPNTSPSDATTFKQDAVAALDKLQLLMNTVYQALGRTQPTSTYTTTQLQSMGLS